MSEITLRDIKANGIRMHVAEAGEGPLVVMLHGFPEGWYSWRHQLAALSEAGFHAVAPDQRGYGRTDRPPEIEKYSMLHLVGDVIGLLDALEESQAVVVGHDWGLRWRGTQRSGGPTGSAASSGSPSPSDGGAAGLLWMSTARSWANASTRSISRSPGWPSATWRPTCATPFCRCFG